MGVPSILQAELLTRLLQGIVLGTAVTMVIGFYWGGWTARQHSEANGVPRTEPTLPSWQYSHRFASTSSSQQEDAAAKLVELKKIQFSWELLLLRRSPWLGNDAGPGRTEDVGRVARACAEMLGRHRG